MLIDELNLNWHFTDDARHATGSSESLAVALQLHTHKSKVHYNYNYCSCSCAPQEIERSIGNLPVASRICNAYPRPGVCQCLGAVTTTRTPRTRAACTDLWPGGPLSLAVLPLRVSLELAPHTLASPASVTRWGDSGT